MGDNPQALQGVRVFDVSTLFAGPDRPLSPEVLATRYRLNAGQCFPVSQAEAFERDLLNLDSANTVDGLMAHTRLAQYPRKVSNQKTVVTRLDGDAPRRLEEHTALP